MIFNFVLLVIGFVCLTKGADVFVESSSRIAMKLKVPQIVIGLTIVAFGTSAPEAAVSLTAAFTGSVGITVGNIIGSNILNILMVLGLAALFSNLKIQKTTIKYEVPLVFFVTVAMLFLGATGSKLSRMDGVILWIIFIGFFIYMYQLSKIKESEEQEPLTEKDTILRLIFFTVIGIAGIVAGSNFTVEGATEIAKFIGISDRIIGLTIVAFGTSLPELVTSVIASRKGKADIAIGNIIGSNLFNILFVIGTVSIIHPITFSSEFYFDCIVAALTVLLLFLLVVRKGELNRRGGIFMLACYAAYFVWLVF